MIYRLWSCVHLPAQFPAYSYLSHITGGSSRDPFCWWFFYLNLKLMEGWFHSHLNTIKVITTKFCTCHDSSAVVACAKICNDLMVNDSNINIPSNSNCEQKSLVKWTSGHWSEEYVYMTTYMLLPNINLALVHNIMYYCSDDVNAAFITRFKGFRHPCLCMCLTHRGLNKMAKNLLTIFSNEFC